MAYTVKTATSCNTFKLREKQAIPMTNIFVCDVGFDTTPFDTGYNKSYMGNIWTDGTNIYFSELEKQFVLDKQTKTWHPKIWEGMTSFYGRNVWSDGINIYHSVHTQNEPSKHHVLSGNIWVEKPWQTNFNGYEIWTDGADIYVSNYTTQLVLNRGIDEWEPAPWSGKTYLYATGIWTDGEKIHYGFNGDYKVLNGTTWERETWEGGRAPSHTSEHWSDGRNIYHTTSSMNTVLKDGVWVDHNKQWVGCPYVFGDDIWTDGTYIYLFAPGDSAKMYVLLPITSKMYFYAGDEWGKAISFDNGISFNINTAKYYAKTGMTWGEWLESDYHEANHFPILENNIGPTLWDPSYGRMSYNGKDVVETDKIIAGATYTYYMP